MTFTYLLSSNQNDVTKGLFMTSFSTFESGVGLVVWVCLWLSNIYIIKNYSGFKHCGMA